MPQLLPVTTQTTNTNIAANSSLAANNAEIGFVIGKLLRRGFDYLAGFFSATPLGDDESQGVEVSENLDSTYRQLHNTLLTNTPSQSWFGIGVAAAELTGEAVDNFESERTVVISPSQLNTPEQFDFLSDFGFLLRRYKKMPSNRQYLRDAHNVLQAYLEETGSNILEGHMLAQVSNLLKINLEPLQERDFLAGVPKFENEPVQNPDEVFLSKLEFHANRVLFGDVKNGNSHLRAMKQIIDNYISETGSSAMKPDVLTVLSDVFNKYLSVYQQKCVEQGVFPELTTDEELKHAEQEQTLMIANWRG